MAVYWVHHYFALPVIFENIAMDEGDPKQHHFDLQSQDASEQSSGFPTSDRNQPSRADQRNMEFAPMPSQQFGHMGTAMSPYDMRHLSSALPDYSQQRYVPSQPQPHISQAPTMDQNLAYSSYPHQQFASQHSGQYASQYSQQSHPQLQRGYSGYNPNIQSSSSDMQSRSQMYLPQQQMSYSVNMPQQPQYSTFGAQQGQYGQMQTAGHQARMGAPYQMPPLQVESPHTAPGISLQSQHPQAIRRNSSNSSLQTSTTLRGPPRKPKQSGHALWVGNLPPGAQIADLKDHFSRDATEDIESVFLISKSNCAFVNYKTEEACAAAMTRFHDSRFRGVRLVCRLRRGSNSAASPASATIQVDSHITQFKSPVEDKPAVEQSPLFDAEAPSTSNPTDIPEKMVKEKFFIVKSLTVEDLERSVNSGIWATQSHNETNLNLAYKTAEHVYLIFSANKSGEYFGYARMESAISADAPQEPEPTPLPNPSVSPSMTGDVPLTIPTSATATAPRGHIIDDSARGTIFWEAESGSLAPQSATDPVSGDSGETSGEDISQKGSNTQQTAFGKTFKISWQSTERLPFYRTRGLRNPWNANREVKIARDGTELEPTIGRKLIGMFEQQAQINLAARTAGPPPQYGYPQQVPQYPTMMHQASYGYPQQGPSNPYGRPY
ncbi:hypothetical protein PMZ80_004644 [Knufia obscura]|uniref:YTH domain-containing protein n=1 Tax=Knufia obscura TaxID=1635080 RepID=A0ABR0RSP5_9EURO|nr:hypothetical protein PMZ80_004644 [Knufia obscura]